MLTDDDLTRQLGSAFRASSDDLAYAGRVPTLRRTGTVTLPLTATVAAATVLVAVAATHTDEPAGPGSATTTPGSSTSAVPRLVKDTVTVAGYTFSYRHAAGEALADDLYAIRHPDGLPDDATPIEAPEGVEAWVGTDPGSGDHAVYVEAPTRNGGDLFAVLSPTWTTDQLIDLFHHGRPRTVPTAEGR